jgi:hypothetical protein
MLIQSVLLLAAAFIEGDVEFLAFMIGAPMSAFFLWIFTLLLKDLLKLLIPGRTGIADLSPLRFWAACGRAIWRRARAKRT